ncbi:hypothetical protein UFOVP368_64 [uncultured Caudovirales phage]|uniref:Uncharacterized protein n=1 Tax=uncultured Caudovirales phage TaxID=2100421 RepID=A0A6J7X2A8_9CAUD|nr:hypothetical protein UFOVP368_64 [uncultured Caudovirales phage]
MSDKDWLGWTAEDSEARRVRIKQGLDSARLGFDAGQSDAGRIKFLEALLRDGLRLILEKPENVTDEQIAFWVETVIAEVAPSHAL